MGWRVLLGRVMPKRLPISPIKRWNGKKGGIGVEVGIAGLCVLCQNLILLFLQMTISCNLQMADQPQDNTRRFWEGKL